MWSDNRIEVPRGIRVGLEHPPIFRTLEQLLQWYEELSQQATRIYLEEGRVVAPGTPPKMEVNRDAPLATGPEVPEPIQTRYGTLVIKALTTPKEVAGHAARQQNCMAGMIPQAQHGDIYLYEVRSDFAPVHSLALVPSDRGLQLLQLYGPKNATPHLGLSAAVREWVESERGRSLGRYTIQHAPQPHVALAAPPQVPAMVGEEDYPF